MSRLLSESFESGTLYRFSSATGGALVKTVVANYPVPNGIRYLELGSNNHNVEKSVSGTEFFVGWYELFQITAQAALIFRWFNGATELGSIWTNALGQLEAYTGSGPTTTAPGTRTLRATGTTILQAGSPTHTLYHIQVHVKLDDTTGVIAVRLNDVTAGELSFTGDTKPGSEATITSLQWISPTGVYYLDNIVVNDASGVSDNTWPGIVKFETMLATGNGFYSGVWQKNTGASADYTYVDENPNDADTTYLFTTSLNSYASFSMADQAISNATYLALITSAIARKDSGTAKLTVGVRDNENNTNYFGVTADLGVSYGIVEERRTVDPSTGTTWTSGGINSTEALIVSAS